MGKLVFQRVTRNVSEETFDCGVESINDYVRNSCYPSIVQHAYAYNISGNGKSLGYIQYLFRDVELEYFPDEIADVDPGVKENTLSALHIRFLAIDRRYQNRHIGTAVLEVFIKKIEELAVDWPIRLITIDARIDLVKWYERNGFKKFKKNTPGQDGVTVAMYYDCMKFPQELVAFLEEMYE